MESKTEISNSHGATGLNSLDYEAVTILDLNKSKSWGMSQKLYRGPNEVSDEIVGKMTVTNELRTCGKWVKSTISLSSRGTNRTDNRRPRQTKQMVQSGFTLSTFFLRVPERLSGSS